MKNLLLVFAFVLICSTGFSQTFSYSSSTIGSYNMKQCNVTVIHGGYNYSYEIYSCGHNTTVIGGSYVNQNLSYYLCYVGSKSGSGNTGSANPYFTSDTIHFVIVNYLGEPGLADGSGSASVTISCY